MVNFERLRKCYSSAEWETLKKEVTHNIKPTVDGVQILLSEGLKERAIDIVTTSDQLNLLETLVEGITNSGDQDAMEPLLELVSSKIWGRHWAGKFYFILIKCNLFACSQRARFSYS
jgi:hypothetical protein